MRCECDKKKWVKTCEKYTFWDVPKQKEILHLFFYCFCKTFFTAWISRTSLPFCLGFLGKCNIKIPNATMHETKNVACKTSYSHNLIASHIMCPRKDGWGRGGNQLYLKMCPPYLQFHFLIWAVHVSPKILEKKCLIPRQKTSPPAIIFQTWPNPKIFLKMFPDPCFNFQSGLIRGNLGIQVALHVFNPHDLVVKFPRGDGGY